MRKLEGVGGVSRRDFLKAAGFAMVLPAIEGCAGTIRIPRTGMADNYSSDETVVNIHGSRVIVLYPQRNLSDSRDYSKGLLDFEGTREGTYRYSIRIPWVNFGSTDMGITTCTQDLISRGVCSTLGQVGRRVVQHSGDVKTEYRIRGGEHSLKLDFSRSYDSVSHTGQRVVDAREFAALVSRVSGRNVQKVEVIVERTNPQITLHAIPVDNEGQIISGYDVGVLALGMTFFPDSRAFFSSISILVDQMRRTGQYVGMGQEDVNIRGRLLENGDRIRELGLAGDREGVWNLVVSIIGSQAEIYRDGFFESMEWGRLTRSSAQHVIEAGGNPNAKVEAIIGVLDGLGPLPRLMAIAALLGAGFTSIEIREAIRRES